MKKFIFTYVFLIGSLTLYAQSTEICNDGIDNDGDGFIDCYDPDCAASGHCSGIFLGNDALCQAIPSAFPQFTMEVDFVSPNETTNHLARMAIGDLDRDGVPEIVTMNKYTDKLFIISGSDGSIKASASVGFDPGWEVAIANINDDTCGEIFFFGYDDPSGKANDGYYIFAYDCNLNFLWKSSTKLRGDPINYGLADFDGDGKVELYAKDEIFDAHTGTRLVKSTAADWDEINGGPVAADILGDDKLELIVGLSIYSVNLGARTADAGSLTLLQSRAEYFIRNEYNATSVADYNLDGFLDVLASGSTTKHGANTTIFFWDVNANTLKTYIDPIAGNFTAAACPDQTGEYYKNGWKNGTGRINIADLDGDGQLNASYVSGKFLYALDENLDLFWKVVVNEETSGYTGCTLFDFNGDGKSEIVYRDEKFLYIIDGTDGSIYNQQACISRTNREYPIVADVDADGSTELCVTCGFNDVDAFNNFCTLSYSQYSHIRVFKSAGEPWVPARRVWNQHGYFVVNVNDDLTIPTKLQAHHLVFSSGSCTVGPNRPLNKFLNQAPFLNSQGCPTYASPDLAYIDNSLAVNQPTCPNQDFTVSFQITNLGDVPLGGLVPITFYDGDPTQAGATKLNTVHVSLNNFGVGAIFDVNNATVNGTGSPFTLFIVLNDGGTTVPTPISLPNTNFFECDYGNNIISAPINPLPVALTALKVQDNRKCLSSTTPDNGAARAFIPGAGGTENTADYNFYWSNGTVAKPVASADFVGPVYTGIPEGTYTVYALHKTANCSSDTVQVVLNRVTTPLPAISIVVDSPVTKCSNPDGALHAVVNGGAPIGDYDFIWYEGNDILGKQIGIGSAITNLAPIVYTVLVRDKITGCESVESLQIPSTVVIPIVTANTVNAICSATNSGSATATIGGATAGFTFKWYNGNNVKPAPDFTGSTYSNLTGGNYTVVAVQNSSNCTSAAITVTVVQSSSVSPITTSVISDQTSCDPSIPNGSASASVGGVTAGFTFDWFLGQNTIAPAVATSATATGLKAGIYTVRATSNATGCTGKAEVTINFAVSTPSLSIGSINDLTDCVTPNGSVTVNPSFDNPSDYTFMWYDGSSVKATPDYAETGNTLSGLPVGTYTVRAIHNTRNCVTAPITGNVADNTPVINIVLDGAITVLPSVCTTADGVMKADVSATGNTSGFMIEWYFGREPFSAPPVHTDNGVSTSTATGLATGIYTVVATNLDNGCSSSSEFPLPFANAHTLTLDSKIDVDQCIPNNTGQITVILGVTPLPGFVESDYVIELYTGMNDVGIPIQTINGVNAVTTYSTTANLTPGFYTLVAISGNPVTIGCRSVPIVVEIEQTTTDPSIGIVSITTNSVCSGATATGSIQLDIDGAAPESDYTYAWFEGPDITSPPLGTATSGATSGFGHIAQFLPGGTYTVQVIKSAGNSAGCTSTATFSVFDNPPLITIASTDISIVHSSRCDVSTGGATINAVSENGSPGTLADYSFEWFDSNMVSLSAGPNSFGPTSPGIYFVTATNTISGCITSSPVEFEILDETIGVTSISLTDFKNPTRCIFNDPTPDEQSLQEGFLTIQANGIGPFAYEWYLGSIGGVPLSISSTITGIVSPGDYIIRITDSGNGCTAIETFTMEYDVQPVSISASASPLTNCIPENASLVVAVTNDGADDQNKYDYQWTINGVPAFSGRQVTGLGLISGTIEVIATDTSDPFCVSNPVTVTIQDLRILPNLTLQEVAPVTNCDPTRPNGVASASVNGAVTDYTFDWYQGNSTSGPVIHAGVQFDQAAIGTVYTVLVTHKITGCSNTAQISVSDGTLPIPMTQVIVLSDVTSCEIDNGILAASVNGNTKDYIFNWYDGTQLKATSDFIGEIYEGLAIGSYSVTATSKQTGCVSPLVTGQIRDARQYPDFNFEFNDATCEQNDGHATIYMTSLLSIDQINWSTSNGPVTSGPNLVDVAPGTYTVTVTTPYGCSAEKELSIGTDIRPFNGISRNQDGQNEYFHIDCIQNFPGNNVKIFNRAGTLVYEVDGYDNIDIMFDGISNKGVSPMGTNLPDGTYYFIVDKRDGSKLLAGYLEIIN